MCHFLVKRPLLHAFSFIVKDRFIRTIRSLIGSFEAEVPLICVHR